MTLAHSKTRVKPWSTTVSAVMVKCSGWGEPHSTRTVHLSYLGSGKIKGFIFYYNFERYFIIIGERFVTRENKKRERKGGRENKMKTRT